LTNGFENPFFFRSLWSIDIYTGEWVDLDAAEQRGEQELVPVSIVKR